MPPDIFEVCAHVEPTATYGKFCAYVEPMRTYGKVMAPLQYLI